MHQSLQTTSCLKFQQEKDKRANYTRTCETGRIQDTTGVRKVFRAPLMLSVPWVSHDVCISSCSVQSLTLYFFLQTIWNMSYVLQCFDKKENKASFKSCSIHSLRELFDCGYRQSRFSLLQSFKKWDLKFQNLYCLLLGTPTLASWWVIRLKRQVVQWMLNIITQRKQNAKTVKSSRHFVEPSYVPT